MGKTIVGRQVLSVKHDFTVERRPVRRVIPCPTSFVSFPSQGRGGGRGGKEKDVRNVLVE